MTALFGAVATILGWEAKEKIQEYQAQKYGNAIVMSAPLGAEAVTSIANTTQKNGEECDKIYHGIDIPTCNGISRKRGPSAAAECFKSPADRYAKCLVGQPIPPLNTWGP